MLVNAAHADTTTFLLQLGTYDSEELATRKWNEVKAKNADVLGTLNLHITAVSLPPENIVSYRTQAGPVASRAQASSLCGTLVSRGAQCYVVETAMLAADNVAGGQVESKTAENTPSPAQRTHAPAIEDDTSHADDPDYIPPPMDSGPVIVSVSEAQKPVSASPAEIAEASPPPSPHVQNLMPAEDAPAPYQAAPVENAAPSRPSAVKERYVAGREPHFLDDTASTTVASAAPASAPVTPAAAPTPPEPESRGFFSRLFGSAPPKPAVAEGVVGSVNVAEAVRVPLSTDTQPPKQQIVPVLPQLRGLGGSPDESTAKTFWAQISYFRDESQALDFFRRFSNTYPQLSNGVRIRITRPFISGASAARVSLRVGPFAGTQDVHTLCEAANHWNARCTVVRDIGASSPVSDRPAANARDIPNQRSQQRYWAQLGTYSFTQDAWDAWKELKAAHRRALGHVRPSVLPPPASSAASPLYRLRAGPFKSENTANTLCSRLQDEGAGCAVVGE